MGNILMKLAYEGTNYLGWQKTSMGPSIEETLEKALLQILQEEVVLQAASRTDAGVHAAGQIVNFHTEKCIPSLQKLLISVNSQLPQDIRVMGVEWSSSAFHPTLDCVGKEYRYFVCNGPAQLPHNRFFSWHFPRSLDRAAMKQAALALNGEHDFSAFCNVRKNHGYEHHVRRIEEIHIDSLPNGRLMFRIRGNHFLYKMVRNLVGTLLYVGCGKIQASGIPSILASQNRTLAGVTAPAHGLCLHEVHYSL